jgi:two-component system, OmpR family, phosphate regulon sensor histidine kinase PhoR
VRRHFESPQDGPEHRRTGRKRLLWQLFPSYLLVTVLSLLVVTLYASEATRRFFRNQTRQVLESRARVLSQDMMNGLLPPTPAGLDAFCKKMGKIESTRLTMITPAGVVVGDSDSNPATMENHAGRPEIKDAYEGRAEGRIGYAVRESPTLNLTMMYVAIAAKDPQGQWLVLRTAQSLNHIDDAVLGLQVRMALVGVAIALAAALVSLVVSRRIARPIEEMKRGVERLAAGELAHRLYVPPSEEIGSLAVVINQMAAQLEDRIRLITAQRNEQEAVFLSMVEGVLAVDMRERVLRMNQAAGELLGATPAEAQGRTIQEVVRNPDLQKFVAQTLSSPKTPTESEILLREDGPSAFAQGRPEASRMGGERWLQAHGAVLHDAAGRQMGAVVVLNDVTRIRRLENFRRDFVANVSHELRTPITAIKGFVETLLDGAMREPESAEKFLGIIARQADRLNAIINDLLLLSKLEQQGEKGTITTESASIRSVLDAAIELCSHKAETKRIPIQVRCPPGLRAKVNVPLLEQALVNLVDNAVKYSEPGKPVTVEAALRNGSLVIQVRDEGPGIEREYLPRIFERFYRVDKGRSRDMGGTGLGLSSVKHIAQAHGGSVAVQSEPGKGSIFTITVPAPQPEGEPPA